MTYLTLLGFSALVAALFVAAHTVYQKFLAHPADMRELRGKIVRICYGNAIEIEIEDGLSVSTGQVFTIFKKLKLQQYASVTDERSETKMLLTPVGEARVISASNGLVACKFRPIDGCSCNPRLGDIAVSTGKKRGRARMANTPQIPSSPTLQRLKQFNASNN